MKKIFTIAVVVSTALTVFAGEFVRQYSTNNVSALSRGWERGVSTNEITFPVHLNPHLGGSLVDVTFDVDGRLKRVSRPYGLKYVPSAEEVKEREDREKEQQAMRDALKKKADALKKKADAVRSGLLSRRSRFRPGAVDFDFKEKYKDLEIKSFCGFEFGKKLEDDCSIPLKKPFRYFKEANLITTEHGKRLYKICLSTSFPNNSEEEINKELVASLDVIAKKYGFENFAVERMKHGSSVDADIGKYCVRLYRYERRADITIADTSIKAADEEEFKKNLKPIQPPSDSGTGAL